MDSFHILGIWLDIHMDSFHILDIFCLRILIPFSFSLVYLHFFHNDFHKQQIPQNLQQQALWKR